MDEDPRREPRAGAEPRPDPAGPGAHHPLIGGARGARRRPAQAAWAGLRSGRSRPADRWPAQGEVRPEAGEPGGPALTGTRPEPANVADASMVVKRHRGDRGWTSEPSAHTRRECDFTPGAAGGRAR